MFQLVIVTVVVVLCSGTSLGTDKVKEEWWCWLFLSSHSIYFASRIVWLLEPVPACTGWKAVNTLYRTPIYHGVWHSISPQPLHLRPIYSTSICTLAWRTHHTEGNPEYYFGTPVGSAYEEWKVLIFFTLFLCDTECPRELRAWLHVKWHSIEKCKWGETGFG